MRYENLTTDQVIDLLKKEGNTIYWTEEAYDKLDDSIDWDRVAKELGTEEIHTFNQGYKTVAYDVKS